MRIDFQDVWSDIQAIKKFSPLVHNITNYVVMEQTANCLLAIGASPIMIHALEEVEDVARSANSLVLNIGTLSSSWIQAMLLAIKAANSKEVPIVFDPVGAGVTSYRMGASKALLNHGSIAVIRGNVSEIISLNGNQGISKGVDSLLNTCDYLSDAKRLALKHQSIVWMSGKTDIVTDGLQVAHIHNGHPMMTKVTGMGCTATALLGAFLAINQDPFHACLNTAILMGIAGEIAAENSTGPASFKSAFVDTLYNISSKEIEERICVEIL